jgi:Zn-dependent protease
MNWWIADLLRDDPALLVSWVVWVIGSIVLHELAHGWAAIWQGDHTPRELGHMTWNPLVHMGGWSLVMFALVGIAWGAMPVNPARFRGRYGPALVALAGPAMNLALAAAAILLGSLWSGYAQDVANPLWRNFMVFFIAGAFLNIALAIFNLLPFPPLDGSRILADFMPSYRRLIEQPNVAAIGIILLIVAFSRGGSFVFDASRSVSSAGFDAATSVLPGAKPYRGPFKHDQPDLPQP